MVFLSSQVSLSELPDTKEAICNKADWFLFNSFITRKQYCKDKNLNGMYNRLTFYPFFYKERLYNYLMTDNYYYNSPLYKIMNSSSQFICMKKVKLFEEIKDYSKEVIKQEDRIFGEEDIEMMFDYFEKNNFRENPICKYVLR